MNMWLLPQLQSSKQRQGVPDGMRRVVVKGNLARLWAARKSGQAHHLFLPFSNGFVLTPHSSHSRPTGYLRDIQSTGLMVCAGVANPGT